MIVMAGMIGVGKTTYTERLASQLGTLPFYEPVDSNPILDKYYEDPDKYGFALQIYFLNKRFGLIKEAYNHNDNVLDRSIYEDALFTKVNMEAGSISEAEYNIYLELLNNMMQEIDGMPKKAPDLMIYLDGSFEKVMENIKSRGRVFEQPTVENDLESYYKTLYDAYGQWYEDYDKGPKVKINVNEYNVHLNSDWDKVFVKIQHAMNRL